VPAFGYQKVQIPPTNEIATVASFGAVSSRGDWTLLELLIAGVRGLEAELCRLIVRLSDGKRP
jgi:hypothetical protein